MATFTRGIKKKDVLLKQLYKGEIYHGKEAVNSLKKDAFHLHSKQRRRIILTLYSTTIKVKWPILKRIKRLLWIKLEF